MALASGTSAASSGDVTLSISSKRTSTVNFIASGLGVVETDTTSAMTGALEPPQEGGVADRCLSIVRGCMDVVEPIAPEDLSPALRQMYDATPRPGLKAFVQIMGHAERFHVEFSNLYAGV